MYNVVPNFGYHFEFVTKRSEGGVMREGKDMMHRLGAQETAVQLGFFPALPLPSESGLLEKGAPPPQHLGWETSKLGRSQRGPQRALLSPRCHPSFGRVGFPRDLPAMQKG